MENILQRPWFDKFPQQKAVCEQILKLLDREGQCPSVVDLHGDVEGNWDENTYRLLAQTTLLDHSLNVAEQVVQILFSATILPSPGKSVSPSKAITRHFMLNASGPSPGWNKQNPRCYGIS